MGREREQEWELERPHLLADNQWEGVSRRPLASPAGKHPVLPQRAGLAEGGWASPALCFWSGPLGAGLGCLHASLPHQNL